MISVSVGGACIPRQGHATAFPSLVFVRNHYALLQRSKIRNTYLQDVPQSSSDGSRDLRRGYTRLRIILRRASLLLTWETLVPSPIKAAQPQFYSECHAELHSITSVITHHLILFRPTDTPIDFSRAFHQGTRHLGS